MTNMETLKNFSFYNIDGIKLNNIFFFAHTAERYRLHSEVILAVSSVVSTDSHTLQLSL